MLRATSFADQMSTCTTAAACFVTNDSPFAFDGNVSVTLVNVLTGNSALLSNPVLSLGPGAGVTKWFCASEPATGTAFGAEALREAPPRGGPAAVQSYTRVPNRIPVGGTAAANSSLVHGAVNSTACEDVCSANSNCVGVLVPNAAGHRCWLYDYVPDQLVRSGADWIHKTVTPPMPPTPRPSAPTAPAPTAPPPCRPPPPELECTAWNRTSAWKTLGCDGTGGNCLLVLEVWATDGAAGSSGPASRNVVPFVPPKSMRLPPSTVTAVVGTPAAGYAETVPITLRASGTALHVVLTTRANGRFSDNVLLLDGGKDVVIDFISWDGALDPTSLRLLQASLRVEHLSENL